MNKLFKILIGLVGGLVLLLVIAAVILPLVYDTEDLKSTIADQVLVATGRKLRIDGDLDFSVFPWLAVEVNQLSLSNAAGFGEQPFAQVGRARVGVALLPLLKKQLVADEVTLDGLRLSLAVNATGQNNWEDLAADDSASEAPSDGGPGLFSSGRIAGLTIRDAQLEFRDQQAGTHYRMERFSLETGPLGGNKPVDLSLAMLLEDVTSNTHLQVALAAVTALDFDNNRHTLEQVRLDLTGVSANSDTGVNLSVRAPMLLADMDAQTLNLDTFTVDLAGLTAEGDLRAQQILDDPAFSGTIRIAEFSPARLMAALGMQAPVTTDPNALQMARASAGFSGNSSQVRLTSLQLDLDQSVFTGELSLVDFDHPVIRFDFNVDAIDIDRYLEPATGDTTQVDIAIPQNELRGQDLQGNLRVGALRLAGLDFSNAVVGLSIKQGKLRINPLTAGFYGGSYSGNVALDGSGATPTLSLDERLDSVSLQSLIAATSKSEALSGTAGGHARLTGSGTTSSAMLGSLQGDVSLALTDGAFEGVNIWYEIRRGLALFKGQKPPPPEPDRTVFTRMQFEAAVKDGVINSRQLVGELPFLSLRGDGSVDLGKSTVDMRLVANVRNMPELSQDPLSAELKGKQLPFRISGSIDDPSVSVDWGALLKGEATNLLLDKLGLKSSTADGEQASDSSSSNGASADEDAEKPTVKEQAQEQAKGLLRGLLEPKKKDPEESDDSDGGG